MKNIYFCLALAAMLAFFACSDKETSESNPSSSSGLGSGACYMNASSFVLCFEKTDGTNITAAECADAAKENHNVPNEIKESCPEEVTNIGNAISCENDRIKVYTYGTTPMPCQSLLTVL